MAGVNKVIIVGNLGADPDVRYMQNGDAVANISVATSETWNDKQTGEKREKTEWHRVVAFRKLGEIIGKYCKKGSKVYVEGKLQTRKWTDKDDIERYTTEIVVEQLQMLDSRDHSLDNAKNTQEQPPEKQNKHAEASGNTVRQTTNDSDECDDDNIPY